MTVLKGLPNEPELEFLLNPLTYELLETFQIPQKFQKSLKLLPQETAISELEFNTLLEHHLPNLGSQQRPRIMDAAVIAFYHHQTDWPVVQVLVCDDAPQFKLLTAQLALCWVYAGRHYKKLTPVVAYHQKLLDEFLKSFWDYYRKLLAYQNDPSDEGVPETAVRVWGNFRH